MAGRRKLDTGGVLSRTFELTLAAPAPLVAIAIVVFLLVALVESVLQDNIFLSLFGYAIGQAGTFVYAGLVAPAVVEADRGGHLSVADTVDRARPALGMLLAVGLVSSLVVLLGLVLLILPGVLLIACFALAPPLIVLTGARFDALGRSVRMQGRGFLTVLVVTIVLLIVQFLAGLLLTLALSAVLGDLLGYWLGALIAHAVVAPLWAVAWTVLYLQLTGASDGAPARMPERPVGGGMR